MGIKIPFLADVAGFLAGTKNIEEALEDVADSLDDLDRADTGNLERDLDGLGRTAETTGTAVEDLGRTLGDLDRVDTTGVESELKEIGTAGDAAAEKLETSFRTAFDTLKREGRTATAQTTADLKDTGHAGSATLHEFSEEAKQNVAESVSSFNGSASSAVDAIQSTFGGLVSALGPAGIVGAAAVGIGIGLARSLFEKSKEQAAEVAEAVADITGQLIDLGRTSLGADQVNEQLKTLASTAEDGRNSLQEIAATAAKAGIGYRDYARGLAGDNEALRRSWEELPKRVAALDQAERDLAHTRGASQDDVDRLVAGQLDERDALAKAREELLRKDATLDQASRTTDLYNEAIAGSVETTNDQAQALRDSNDALREQADLKGDAVLNELDMLDALDGVTTARKRNGKSLSDNTAAGRDNIRAVKSAVDGIKEYGDALVDTGAKSGTATKEMERQERVLVTKVAKAFGITEKQAKAYIETLGGIPPVKNTKVTVTDDGSARRVQERIDNIRSSGVPVPINPKLPSPAALQRQINAYYNGLSIKVPVALDRYRSGKSVDG